LNSKIEEAENNFPPAAADELKINDLRSFSDDYRLCRLVSHHLGGDL